MSAEVEKMFSVREMPWHREGTVLADYPETWEEARTLAGLDWEPQPEPCFALTGLDGEGQPVYAPIGGWQRITRSDTGATLAVTKESYAIISNGAFGEIFEAVLQQTNVKAETGGCLDEGRAVWMLVKLDEPIIVPGDSSPTLPYLALMSRHDAGASAALRATAVRIVCANTFRAAEMEGERRNLPTYGFRHTSGWRDRLADAREAVTGARKEMADYAELATELMGVKIDARARKQFVTAFIPAPPAGLASKRVLGNVERSRAELRKLIAGPTVTGAGIEGTAWGMVQAAGEYLDHVRKARTWETKLNRTLLQPEPLKAKARKIALEVAKG